MLCADCKPCKYAVTLSITVASRFPVAAIERALKVLLEDGELRVPGNRVAMTVNEIEVDEELS